MPRLTVNFFTKEQPRGADPIYAWYDAGQAPVIGDFIITPLGNFYEVTARTWQLHRDEALHCNVVVKRVEKEDEQG